MSFELRMCLCIYCFYFFSFVFTVLSVKLYRSIPTYYKESIDTVARSAITHVKERLTHFTKEMKA